MVGTFSHIKHLSFGWLLSGKVPEVLSITLKLRIQAGNTYTKKYLDDNSIRPTKKYIFTPFGSLTDKDPEFDNSLSVKM